jgi:Tol biopolymer transport system component
MALAPGQKLGAYEIVAPLGAGGMGEVYRARDTRLGREVAIKALPDAFALDPERLGRFEREAKLLASLNHPNIGSIYGLEVVDGHRYLVLEFIEGETVADVLARGPLPIGETVELCSHVAAALESAHESGIVHRDLKPANVMLTRAGTVKVLDFGLAKAAAPGGESDPALSASPTMTYGATQAGMVLGTAAYMSPEQARGKAVDKRTDIWSFGCLLYECLTGKQAFRGETVSDLIAHILTSEPDWNALPPATPPRVRELLRRCLEKDARRRLRDMGDARIELEETLAPRGSSSMAVPASIAAGVDAQAARPKKRRYAIEIGAAVLGAILAVFVTRLVEPLLGTKAPARAPVRFQVVESDTMKIAIEGAHLALSPDGTMLAFVAGDSIMTQLWVRPLGAIVARPLAGTVGAILPFWSPDSKWIAFFAKDRLKRVPATGGDVEDLTEVRRARGGTWNPKDEILYAPTSDGPLFAIPASGGDPRPVTSLDSTRGETGHRFPQFLPDGKHFLFVSLPPRNGKFIMKVGSIDGGRPDSVAALPSGATYAAPGFLVYLNGLTLMGQRFSPSSHEVKGAPVPLREMSYPTNFSGSSAVSASRNGVLAFAQFNFSPSRFAWFDDAGREIGQVPIEPGLYVPNLNLSPDGKRLAFVRAIATGAGALELLVGDVERGVTTVVDSDPTLVGFPRWSPDGTRIATMNSPGGPQYFVVRTLGSSSAPRAYLEGDPAFKTLDGWTPDGRSLIFDRQAAATRWDLYVLDVETGKAAPYLSSPANETESSISPDGGWAIYLSDETGRDEVFVQSFPVPGHKYQVTTAGGLRPGWLHDGRVTFALVNAPFDQLVANVIPGPEFRVGPPRLLLRAPKDIQAADRTRDGRTLIQLPSGKPQPIGITVVLDWQSALRKR